MTEPWRGRSWPILLLLLLMAFALSAAVARGQIVLSEIMYDPTTASDGEFIELHNAGSAPVALLGYSIAGGITYTFTNALSLAAGEYLVIAKDRDVFSTQYPAVTALAAGDYAGKLANEGELVTLLDNAGNTLFRVDYRPFAPWPVSAAGLGSSLVLLDPSFDASLPASWGASAAQGGSPGSGGGAVALDVLINEILARSSAPYEDAIELINVSSASVDIGGWRLSDDANQLDKFQIPSNTVLAAHGGKVVFYEGDFNPVGGDTNRTFAINGSRGDDIYLSLLNTNGDVIRIADHVETPPTYVNTAFGRVPDGGANFSILAAPTFGVVDPNSVAAFRGGAGADNAPPRMPAVVISELMYHPPDINGLDNQEDEYVELWNTSTNAMPLYLSSAPTNTWSLAGAVMFTFPTNVILQPGERMLILSSTNVSAFVARHQVPLDIRVFGGWSGKLDNSGERLQLLEPTFDPVSGSVAVAHDEVRYRDALPWPLAADGYGSALERRSDAVLSDLAESWQASTPGGTPGRANTQFDAAPDVVISEFLAHNLDDIRDVDGDHSDWIELQRTTNTPMQLEGWYLTDDPRNLTKWQFDATRLQNQEYMLVFASGKDRADPDAQLHANFRLSASGEFLALVMPDGVTIASSFSPTYPQQYADLSYGPSDDPRYHIVPTAGEAGGLGWYEVTGYPVFSHLSGLYTNDFMLTLSHPDPAVVVRYTLDGSDPTESSPPFTNPILIVPNVEVRARAYKPQTANGPIVSHYYRKQFVGINEFVASNLSTAPEMVDFSDFVDWFELYNGGTNAFDLGGFYLSDNFEDPLRWRIPDGLVLGPGEHLIMYADGEDEVPGTVLTRPFYPGNTFTTTWHHVNFRLSSEGEALLLSSPGGALIDGLRFDLQARDVSYGRLPDGGDEWVYFAEPTPMATNQAPGIVDPCVVAAAPLFDLEGGFYATAQMLTLTHTSATTAIHYTLDGSRPSSASPQYAQPINIATTMVVRARAIATNRVMSSVVTHTYFIDDANQQLPIVSITTDPLTMFDSDIGIFENGLKRREVPVHIEFYEDPDTKIFSEGAGLRISGLNVFRWAQKPFSINFRGKYGSDGISYQLFPDKPIGFFDRFTLRNGGDNWPLAMMRDPASQLIYQGKSNILIQGFRPAASYLNGEYYGILHIRERSDETFIRNNYPLDIDNTDYLEFDRLPGQATMTTLVGTLDEWNELVAWAKVTDFTIQSNYNAIAEVVDVDDMIDFACMQIWAANSSWGGNLKWYREKVPGGKWRWVIVDLDRAMYNTRIHEPYSRYITRNLEPFKYMKTNPGFRTYFLGRLSAHLNTTFNAERVQATIMRVANSFASEVPRHSARWAAEGGIPSVENWEAVRNNLLSYAAQRVDPIFVNAATEFGLTNGTAEVVFDPPSGGDGRVLVNHVLFDQDVSTNKFFNGLPLQLEAVPDIGQQFVGWEVNEGGALSTNLAINLTYTPDGNARIRPIFAPLPENTVPELLAGDMTLTATGSPYYATGDIIVPSNTTFTIEAGVQLWMPQGASIYVYGELLVEGTPAQPVSIGVNTNRNAEGGIFQRLDSLPAGFRDTRWGGIAVHQATAPTRLNHLIIRDASEAGDPVNQKSAISGFESELYMDGLDLDDINFPIFVQYGARTELRNSRIHTDVTSDLINVKYADYAVVADSELIGDSAPDTDAIDFDQLNGGLIEGNRIHSFAGFNSDAIDAGEQAQNIVIRNNLIYDCTDKGISVGQGSTVSIVSNLIIRCNMGVGIKDTGSYAFIDRNTFYENDLGVAVFEKNKGAGGGRADVENTIFANSATNAFLVDALSSLSIAYSLSNTDPLPGVGNWAAAPGFVDPAQTNFNLRVGSLAVNHGNPLSTPDPDGTVADMGALPLNLNEGHLVISEIYYRPDRGVSNEYEYIEIYNAGGMSFDLSGGFMGGVTGKFPPGTVVASGESIVLAANAAHYAAPGLQVVEWTSGSLDNNGETVRLYDAHTNLLDKVQYDNNAPWPVLEAGTAIQLIHPMLDNDLGVHWRAHADAPATPGVLHAALTAQDLVIDASGPVVAIQISSVPALVYTLEFSPSLHTPNWQPVANVSGAQYQTLLLEHRAGQVEPIGYYRLKTDYR